MDSNTQTIQDRWAIVDTLSRYARGIDRKDATLYRSCFTDEVEVDMGGGLETGIPADLWVDQALSVVKRYEATQHIISNHVISLEAEQACCRAEVQAQHWNPTGAWKIGGHYDDHLMKTAAGWCIQRLTLKIRWFETTGDAVAPGRPRPAQSPL
ncbi:nuclear transport factor 2 family protein [Myxococcota bacterium]|nr:nuclear transport factor 2 family protein [Myxococcota bacterium]